ncbi:MAG: universal stress protein, partial [Sodaliphilus sp.]|nr:universal stress protein [Bacteroidales bacterium]MDY5537647.1 universal stress protein [Sodaliphilus sp.]
MASTQSNNNDPNRLITLAIHTYDRAVILKFQLEQAGITAVLHNVNLSEPVVSAGVRVRIREKDLPKALAVVESEQAPNKAALKNDRKVLIPVDFSDYSIKSCIVGFEYARRYHGSVVLLHAYMNAERKFTLPFGSDRYERSGDDDNTLRAKALLAMKNLRSKLEKMIVDGKLANVAFETAVREGVPEHCVLSCAEEVKAC